MKSTIVFLIGLAISSFQAHAASLCNGGFEEGGRCWGNLTEHLGFAEVASSYTDARGFTFTPTEGSFFYNFWGGEDLAQGDISWKKGDLLSYDWAVAAGTDEDIAGLFVDTFDGLDGDHGLSPGETTFNSATGFNSVIHKFIKDSPEEHPILVFQAGGTASFDPITEEQVAHTLLDNVKITSVPLPGSALFLITSLFFGYFGRRMSQIS